MGKMLILMVMGAIYPVTVFAYIDPGSGALLIQGLLALIGAVIVFVKSPVKYIKLFYTDLKNRILKKGGDKTNHKDGEDA